ncbi:MAG: type II secretion system protein [Candidatus Eremiobacterota bacterium]
MLRRRRGISLLEVILGFTILVTAFLALLEVFPMANQAVHRGKDQLVATQLAQGYLDEMRSRNFDAMGDLTALVQMPFVVNDGSSSQQFNVMVQVLPEPAGTPLLESASATLRVQVEWRQRGQGEAQDANGALRMLRLESTRVREL